MHYDELVRTALAARKNAYAPYSKFCVGAALRTQSGRVYSGVNIENVSLGLTICAERVCVGAAVAAGETNFEAIAVVADSKVPVVPCGACRQVLAEFNPTLKVVSATIAGEATEFQLEDLLPKPKQGIL